MPAGTPFKVGNGGCFPPPTPFAVTPMKRRDDGTYELGDETFMAPPPINEELIGNAYWAPSVPVELVLQVLSAIPVAGEIIERGREGFGGEMPTNLRAGYVTAARVRLYAEANIVVYCAIQLGLISISATTALLVSAVALSALLIATNIPRVIHREEKKVCQQ